MPVADRTRSTKFPRPDHANFEIVGKPALCVNHLQRERAGEGLFIPRWEPNPRQGILDSGMVEICRELADAFRSKGLSVIFINTVPKFQRQNRIVRAQGFLSIYYRQNTSKNIPGL